MKFLTIFSSLLAVASALPVQNIGFESRSITIQQKRSDFAGSLEKRQLRGGWARVLDVVRPGWRKRVPSSVRRFLPPKAESKEAAPE